MNKAFSCIYKEQSKRYVSSKNARMMLIVIHLIHSFFFKKDWRNFRVFYFNPIKLPHLRVKLYILREMMVAGLTSGNAHMFCAGKYVGKCKMVRSRYFH